MIPIHELLSRIRWDPEFGQGRFELGYFDRHQASIQRVAFETITFPEGASGAFELLDAETGHTRHIPLHRVREVLKDGQLIWQRG